MTHFIGKRVIVRAPIGRDEKGKSNKKMIEFGGMCDYIGPNPHLKYDLVIIVNRMPVELQSIDQVKLC